MVLTSGVARAFPGGRVSHPKVQNEEENEEKLRKNEGKYRKMRKIIISHAHEFFDYSGK